MFNRSLMSFFVVCVITGAQNHLYAEKKSDEDQKNSNKNMIALCQNAAKSIQEKLPYKSDTLQDIMNADSFSEYELLTVLDAISKPQYASYLSDEDFTNFKEFKKRLKNILKNFTITGFSFCVNPNKGLIKDTQDPCFDVVFKNNAGRIKQKTFQAKFVGYGFKIQLAFKFDFIFFLGTDINFLDTQEPIELGGGFEFAVVVSNGPFVALELTFISFKNHSGGMLMCAPVIGLCWPSLSYITEGGTLTPIN